MNSKLVSVNIVSYNAQDLIEPCLESVFNQTYKNIEILVIDNASTDNTLEKIQITKSKLQINSGIKAITNAKNVGFAAGHNIGIRESKGEYLLFLNQDIILDKEFVKRAVEAAEIDEKIGAVQGKLYKITNMREFDTNNTNKNFSEISSESVKVSDILDTTGLLMFKNRRVVCRGQGEKDKNQYGRGEIFGVDGAAPLYRREALENIKLPNNFSAYQRSHPRESAEYEYFDEDFFMYKEDVDLAWRMRLYDWKAVYEPTAIGYHLRGAGEGTVKDYASIIKARKRISNFAKYYSFKNQRLMEIKNDLFILRLLHFHRIIIKEIGAWVYILFFEKYSWKAIKDLFKQMPLAWRKRKFIMKRRKTRAAKIAKWFV